MKKKLLASLALALCLGLMGLFRFPSAGRAGGGAVEVGCGAIASTSPQVTELATVQSALVENDIEDVDVQEGKEYTGGYLNVTRGDYYIWNAKAFDWNSCINGVWGQCVEQWGSFPAACDGKQSTAWNTALSPTTLGFAWTAIAIWGATYTQFQKAEYHRFFPGKRCRNIKNTRVSKDGGASCYGGRWNSYNSPLSFANTASTYRCDIKDVSATKVKVVYSGGYLSGGYTASHDTSVQTEREPTVTLSMASDESGSDATTLASGDSSTKVPYLDGYQDEYFRYCVTPRFLAEKHSVDEAQADYPNFTEDKLENYVNQWEKEGDEKCSDWTQLDVPIVQEISYTLSGTTATGAYTYQDSSRAEQGSIIEWISYHYDGCIGGECHEGVNSQTGLVIDTSLLRKTTTLLKLCVTPYNGLTYGPQKCTDYAGLGDPQASTPVVTVANGVATATYSFTDVEEQEEYRSTFTWKRAADWTGEGAVEVSSTTASGFVSASSIPSHTVTADDFGYWLVFCVTPADHLIKGSNNVVVGRTGTETCSEGVLVGAGATGVTASASGGNLTGSYTYTNSYGTAESGSTFRWLAGASADGSDAVEIANATSTTFTQTNSQAGKYLFFCVTPSDGTSKGQEQCSSAAAGRPYALSPGLTFSGATVTGTYTFTQVDSLAESGSTYLIQRASSASGPSTATVSTARTYALTWDDSNKYLRFCVTPKDAAGTSGPNNCGAWTAVGPVLSMYGGAFYSESQVTLPLDRIGSGTCVPLGAVAFDNALSSFRLQAQAGSSTTVALSNDSNCANLLVTQSAAAGGTASSPWLVGAQDNAASSVWVAWNVKPKTDTVKLTISGRSVTTSYNYTNDGGIPESGSTWYIERGNAVPPTTRTTLTTGNTWTIVAADEDQYLRFCVTPRDVLGTVGSENCSSWTSVGPLLRLFQHSNHLGTEVALAHASMGNGTCGNLSTWSLNDAMSSFKLEASSTAATTVLFYKHADCDGDTLTATAAAGNTVSYDSITSSLNDQISSVRVVTSHVPSASGVTAWMSGKWVYGSFTYANSGNVEESGSTYTFKRASSSGGSGATTIATFVPSTTGEQQGVALSYGDSNSWMQVCVTPKDVLGTSGAQSCSAWTAVGATFTVWQNTAQGGTSVTVAHENWGAASTSRCINLSQFAMNDAGSSFRLNALASAPTKFTLWADADCKGFNFVRNVAAGGTDDFDIGSGSPYANFNDVLSSIQVEY